MAAGFGGGLLLGGRSTEPAVPGTDSTAPASPSPQQDQAAGPAESTTGPDDTTSPDGPWVVTADTDISGYVFFPVGASSDCVLEAEPDAEGNLVEYDPSNAIDKLDETAWRCRRETARLVLDLGNPTDLDHVGLIPGYLKTDPYDETDRFTQNLTVTRAVWTFHLNGRTVGTCTEVIDDPEPTMEWAHLPATVTADELTLDIVETGNRDALRRFPTIASIAVSGIGLVSDGF
ncbi:hypothetical protein [Streptomyces kebangsaanensis]|uniref:hypothetical protein n=1 Tax=Streptomyces kebangsaanensis TaxID=864058 RepID=UPI00093EA666|nr:hypothetical protein [Streptomyces kebangsaanensis]